MYHMLKNSADPSRHVIKQRRYYFLWEMQSFHVYEYLQPQSGLWTIQCQCQGEPLFPSFFQIGEEVDDDDETKSSYYLSKK